MGRCAVVTDNDEGFLCGTGSFFIRPYASTDPHYLAQLLRSKRFRMRIQALASGSTMPNLSNTALSGLEIELPNEATQRRRIEEIRILETQISSLSGSICRKIMELNLLKQSILQRAFSGKLTQRDPIAA
jgi:type I restriction enzyme S subunit